MAELKPDRGNLILEEVIRRLKAIPSPSGVGTLLSGVRRADVDPWSLAAVPAAIVPEPEETYAFGASGGQTSVIRSTMLVPIMVSVRAANDDTKAAEVRKMLAAIWSALFSDAERPLGGLAVNITPVSSSMAIADSTEPLSVLRLTVRIVYDFLLQDPTTL